MNIEIITTANSNLKETGFGSYASCQSVLKSLQRQHSVRLSVCSTMQDLADVLTRKPAMVMLAAKYMPMCNGADVWFSEFFDNNQMAFTGSNRAALAYDSDKISAKIQLDGLGIKTARYFTAIPLEFSFQEELPLEFPLFLKPIDAANGNGVDDLSFVEDFGAFETKVLELHQIYGAPVLVEEYLGGKEYTVAIIKSKHGKMITSAIEISPPLSSKGLRILGSSVKTTDTETLKSVVASDLFNIEQMALAAFRGLGARGFARIDVKTDLNGQCFFMEANLVPGMSYGSSYFPQACELANNLSYDEVVDLMIDECRGRWTDVQEAGDGALLLN